MRIAFASLYLPSGSKIGSGYQAHYMSNAMARRGHEVTMFSPCPPCGDALYRTCRVDVGQRLRTFRFAWELRKIDWPAFDVIHAHGDDYLLRGRGIPIHVRTMHGSCLAEAMSVPRAKEKLRMAMLGLSEVAATLVADRTVCVSRNTTRYYPWVRDVIVNGVDLEAFHPRGEREADPTILFVGTYQNRKRGKLLMEAFGQTIRLALPQARLWMVCNDAPAEPGVTVFGRISTEQLAELYRKAWVFCLPSSYEGFGVPYIEAMASGTPVVATPNPGALEVLQNGRFGVIVEPHDLGQEILSLLRDPERRQRLSRDGLAHAQEFGWDRIAAAYETVYLEIAEKRRRSGRPCSVGC